MRMTPRHGPLQQCCTHFSELALTWLRRPTADECDGVGNLELTLGVALILPGSHAYAQLRSRQTRLRRKREPGKHISSAGFVADDRRRSSITTRHEPRSSSQFEFSMQPLSAGLAFCGSGLAFICVRVVAIGCNCRRLVMEAPRGNSLRFLCHIACSAALLLALSSIVAAEDYPTRTVRLIVPFPPGGSNDVVGRLVASQLSERLGQQVFVDNRGGAGGVIGTEAAATAAPDGYTLLIVSIAHAVNPALYKLNYDPVKSFVPVTILAPGQMCSRSTRVSPSAR
jgi:hypothetical protein